MDNKLKKLILEFRELAYENGRASLSDDYKEVNRTYKKLDKTLIKIWQFGKDGCVALLTLLDDDDISVQSWAAVFSLKFDEELAMKTLLEVSRVKNIIGFSAIDAIENWENGNFDELFEEYPL